MTVDEVVELTKTWYARGNPGEYSGGAMHIVTDDGNTETHHVKWCMTYAFENGELTPELLEVGLAWLGLPENERDRAYTRYSDYRTV